MFCNICKKIDKHDSRCPNYVPNKAIHYCSICGEPILNGEEYIVSDSGKYAHWECFSVIGNRELAKWLELTVQIMEDD